MLSGSDLLDYRESHESSKRRWGRVASIWSIYLPQRSMDIVLTHVPAKWKNLLDEYAASGWKSVTEPELVVLKGKEIPASNFLISVLENGDRNGVLCYTALQRNGDAIPIAGEDGFDDKRDCVMFHIFSEFVRSPNDTSIARAKSEFVEAIGRVASELKAGPRQ